MAARPLIEWLLLRGQLGTQEQIGAFLDGLSREFENLGSR